MLFVYHKNCLDGLASLWASGQQDGLAYDPSLPCDFAEVKDTKVFFLDCAPSVLGMENLKKNGCSPVILDHHISNSRALGIELDTTKAGCWLAWEYFHPGEPLPEMLRIIGERDLGRFSDPRVRHVGISLMHRSLRTVKQLDELINRVDDLEKEGAHLQSLMEDRIQQLDPRICTWGEWKVAVAEVPDHLFISELASEVLGWEEVDFSCLYFKEGEKFRLSFRSRKPGVDLAHIVKQWGGGGHKQAAGALVDQLPF